LEDKVTAKQTRYVIIGASAAGMAAANAIRELDSSGIITVLSMEKEMPYFRPMIPFLISGKKSESDIALVGNGPYKGKDINICTGARVTFVDTKNKIVSASNSKNISYDKLLIASGSSSFIPPEIEGTNSQGVFALRTLSDAKKIADLTAKTRQVVMAGGGMLNLKTAFALLERGLEVILVVYSGQVLSQLMEADDAKLIRKALNIAGLKIITGCGVKKIISGNNGVKGVMLSNGKQIEAEMVLIGKGVSPNIDFLDKSSIRIDRGVVADEYTATNIPDVYAAGDVAESFDLLSGKKIISGLWTNAAEMGRCAGRNMAGRHTRYLGSAGILNATQVADVPFVSMGIVHTKGTDYETHVTETQTTYKKLVFSSDSKYLVGALFVGDIKRAGLYRFIIREKKNIDNIKSQLINHKLHYGHFLQ